MRKRLRRTMKWSGTVLTVLLLVVWVGSVRWKAGCGLWPAGAFWVQGGQIGILWNEPWPIIPVEPDWWPPARHSEPFLWWFDGGTAAIGGDVTDTAINIPIWVLVVLVATPTLWLWRRDRRRQPGLCSTCGYDLRGADHPVCPECGQG